MALLSDHIFELLLTMLLIPAALSWWKDRLDQQRMARERSEARLNNTQILVELVARLTELKENVDSLKCNFTKEDSVNLAVMERRATRREE